MSVDKRPEPICVLEGNGAKLRNGLFLRAIVLYADRIAFDVYASRAFQRTELVSLTLADGVDTKYEMAPWDSETIDGNASIEFTPGLPESARSLHLSQPGRGLHVAWHDTPKED